MTEDKKIILIRRELPAVEGCVYLNTGTCGPLPRRTVAAAQAAAEHELAHGRIDFADLERVLAARDELRADFARLLGADPAEVALTHHTTDGMNIGIWGLNWQSGDELVTTNLEHEGGLMPAYALGRRAGVTVRIVDLGLGGRDVVERLEQAITPRTRLLSLSHVTYSSGARLPLAEIVAMAHRHHVLVLADGAQSAGAIPLNLHELGVDMYAVPGQKWLCGPEGVGAFYLRRGLLSELSPLFVGYLSLWPGMNIDLTGQFQLSPDARRYEVGSVYRPNMFAMRQSLRWLEEDVGWTWAFGRVAALAEQTVQLLGELPGVRILTPANRAGLISFSMAGRDPEQVANVLAEQRIRIRWIKHPRCLRVSTGFYNTAEDLIELRDALAEITDAA